MNKQIKRLIEEYNLAFNPINLKDSNEPNRILSKDIVNDALYYRPKNPEELKEIVDMLIEQGIMDLNCIDTSRIKDFSYMFQEMKGLQNLDISEWDVSKGKEFTFMFCGCTDFNSDISNWNMGEARKCYGMFQGCKEFNCDISGRRPNKLQDGGSMFCGCHKFNQDLSEWLCPNIYDVGFMFANCKNFNKECIDSWNLSPRTTGYENMFFRS